MLSFVTAQAIALSQVKAAESKPIDAAQDRSGAAPRRRKYFFTRVFDALVAVRMRKAVFAVQAHRQVHRDGFKN